MLISIVTPAYNASRYIAQTIESCINQTFHDWELIVVDDGSADNTSEIVQSFVSRDSRIQVVSKPNGGVADARNFGYNLCDKSSEYVIFLDHDDIWKPYTLEKLLIALRADTQAVAVHALSRQTDLNGNPVGAPGGTIMAWHRRKIVGNTIIESNRTEPTTFNTLICDCCIPTPGITLIRKSSLDTLRTSEGIIFDQRVASGDDWDVWLRLSLRGHFAFVDEVLIDWRQHEANGSKNEYVTFAAETKVRHKIMKWPELSPEQIAMAEWRYRRLYASIERRNAKLCWKWAVSRLTQCPNESVRLFKAWYSRYRHYLILKLVGVPADCPLPKRLVEPAQELEA